MVGSGVFSDVRPEAAAPAVSNTAPSTIAVNLDAMPRLLIPLAMS